MTLASEHCNDGVKGADGSSRTASKQRVVNRSMIHPCLRRHVIALNHILPQQQQQQQQQTIFQYSRHLLLFALGWGLKM